MTIQFLFPQFCINMKLSCYIAEALWGHRNKSRKDLQAREVGQSPDTSTNSSQLCSRTRTPLLPIASGIAYDLYMWRYDDAG